MAGSITLSEKGIKVTQKEGNGKKGVTIGTDISHDITVGPLSVSVSSNGKIGGKVSAGGFTVGADSKGGFTASTPIGGVTYNSNGSGEITAPFGVAKVEVEKSGCTYILRTYIAGGLVDTEVREIPGCKEDNPPPPPVPPPPPPPPSTFTPFNPGNIDLPENKIVIATFNWRFSRASVNYSNEDGSSYPYNYDYNQDTTADIPNYPYIYAGNYDYRFEGFYEEGYGWVYTVDDTYVLFSNKEQYGGRYYRHKERRIGTLYTKSANETCHVNDNWTFDFLSGYECRKVIGPPAYDYDPNWITWHFLVPNDDKWGNYPRYYYGSWGRLKDYISKIQYKRTWSWSNTTGGGSGFIAVELKDLRLYHNTGKGSENTIISTPPTMTNCCKEQKVDLARLEEALERLETVIGTKAILNDKDGYAVPNKMLIPGGDGYTYSKSYLGIFTSLFASIDRYGFDGPIVVDIPDVAKDKSGDQGIRIQVNSLSTAIQTLLSLAIENKGDASTRLNIQVRLAFMQTRMMRMTHKIYYLIVSILEGLGIPTIKKIIKGIPFEFNLNPEELGFGKKAEELDTMDEDSLEAQLPKILDTKEVDLVVEAFKPNQLDLRGFLIKLINKQ